MGAFGPNTAFVADCIARIQTIPWFTRIEQAHPQDAKITRVPLTWLLDQPERPWHGALAAHETLIERCLLDSGRLGFQVALDQYFEHSFGSAVDDLTAELIRRFPNDFDEEYTDAKELLDTDTVERIVRYALYECLVDDLDPQSRFSRSMLDWFAEGYWPCGWSAEYPDGHLVVL
jgi:hypothetical protein